MSWQFWTFLIVGAIGAIILMLGLLTRARAGSDREIREAGGAATMVGSFAIVVAVIFLLFGLFTIVGTRQVGIVTSFNKPTGETFSNGLHFKAPWVNVTEFDAAVQNDVYNGDNRISVRLGNNSTALADANIRWQIKQDAADELFVQYKTFDGVKSNLIDRNLRVALNESFGGFDPLAPENEAKTNNLAAVTTKSLKLLREKVGDQVEILDVSVPIIDYDEQTEQRINAINGSKADQTRALIEAQTAETRANAAKALANMPPPDLRIAISACLNKMAETGNNLNCLPIGGGVVPTLSIPSPLPAG